MAGLKSREWVEARQVSVARQAVRPSHGGPAAPAFVHGDRGMLAKLAADRLRTVFSEMGLQLSRTDVGVVRGPEAGSQSVPLVLRARGEPAAAAAALAWLEANAAAVTLTRFHAAPGQPTPEYVFEITASGHAKGRGG